MLARGAVLLAALALVLSGAAASGDVAPAVEGAHGIGDPYFPLDGNGGIDVRSYDVHDSYGFAGRRIEGWTTVRLRTTEALSSFDLDFLLPVRSVRLSTGASTFSRPSRHELTITPRHPIAAGTDLRVRVAYAGHPGRVAWGGESNWVASDTEVLSVGEPHMAAWWFPSNDHPLDKARMDLHITVPDTRQVVAGGRLMGVHHSPRHATYHWRASSMATYLAFFVAGRFDVRHGTSHGLPYYLAVSRDLPPGQRRAAMRGLLHTPGIVGWLSTHLGRYPFSRTGGVVTALDPGFSLETQTRPTYPQGVSRLLMVHELAHQWFGDSVSVHHWRDVWLNEGFATFMEQLWNEDHGGPTTTAWLAEAFHQSTAGAPFWQLTVADPGPDDLFDWAVYERGAMTLAALRHRIGRDDFAHLLRAWTFRHRHGHGTTARFQALATSISGQDLGSFFDAWLVQPTRPAATAANGL